VESLGIPILEPQTYGNSGQIAAAIAVALITLATDAGLGLAQKVATPKGLRVGAHGASPGRKRLSFPVLKRTETT
jgi:hypothetical protein